METSDAQACVTQTQEAAVHCKSVKHLGFFLPVVSIGQPSVFEVLAIN